MVVWRRRSINQCAARLGYWEPGGRGGRGRLRRPAAAPSFPRMKLRAVRRHGAGACRMHGVCIHPPHGNMLWQLCRTRLSAARACLGRKRVRFLGIRGSAGDAGLPG